MNEQDDLKRLLKRHGNFWRMEPADRPLMSVVPYQPMRRPQEREGILWGGRHFEEGERITPDSVDLHHVRGEEPDSIVHGDFIRGVNLPGICWTEAVLGCPVRMGAGGVWAEHFLDWTDVKSLCAGGKLWGDNPWLEKYREGTRILAEQAEGRYPIVQTLLRGPVDMMASALGHDRMVLAFLDHPDEAHALLNLCADLFIHMAETHLSLVPPFHGGYITYGIWAPGSVVRTQLDNAVLLSPELYREYFLPGDARIFRHFEYVVIHVHSACLHIVDDLLAQDELNAIQVSLDFPGGPSMDEVLPILERIQGKKPLILTGPVTDKFLQLLLDVLSPAGLCLAVRRIGEGEDGLERPNAYSRSNRQHLRI